MICLRASLSLVLLAGCVVLGLRAEVPAPPPPATYDVLIRYRIDALRNERVVQYFAMMRFLKSVGFERDPEEEVPPSEPEDVKAPPLHGFIPSANARKLLAERHVRTVRLMPKGAQLPEDKAQPVRVHLELATGFSPKIQRVLADQVRQVLSTLGFREGVGYDKKGNSRLVGSVPVGQLGALVNDLRDQPAAAKLGEPIQRVPPIRLVEVLPGMALPATRPAPPAVPKGQENLSADLRAFLAQDGKAAGPVRLEVILANAPTPEDAGWQQILKRAAPGLEIEGRLGALVTVRAAADQILALAAQPEVAAVRLPRTAQGKFHSLGKTADESATLSARELERLHRLGHRGKGTRVAIIAGDFRGWDRLPAGSRLVDLTRERNRDLQADPFPTGGDGTGHGTRCAQAVLRAAPETELTLIRIDPAAPYMVESAARAINGEPYRTLSMENRSADLNADRTALELRRERINEERRLMLEDFSQEEEAVKRREAFRQREAELERDERAYHDRLRRYLQHLRDVMALKNVRIVVCPLVWAEGHPVDGGSALSRYFDDRPFKGALWFQSAGDTRDQAWAGLFRDQDGNGVMEFAAPGAELPAGSWSRELNFLAWQAADGKPSRDLPQGAKIRVSIQWKEAHDPDAALPDQDPYREPLAKIRLVLLRQPDPTGTKRPADDMIVVAQSAGLPQRLTNSPTAATYEQTVEFTVPESGRYAVRVEGRAPESTRPANAPTLPILRQFGEMRARVFVATVAGGGRAIFHDFPTTTGSIGMPGDAHAVVTVSSSRSYGAEGPAFNLALLPKPNLLASDRAGDEGSTGLAASYAAGAAATVRSAGVPLGEWLAPLKVRPGGLLQVPTTWER
jgi:hypothetical protein